MIGAGDAEERLGEAKPATDGREGEIDLTQTPRSLAAAITFSTVLLDNNVGCCCWAIGSFLRRITHYPPLSYRSDLSTFP